jgi:uncharacterized membrane protein YoaK (UPF0700 family)
MNEDAIASPVGRKRLLVLAFAAGSVDAISYLGLGRAFPANMTGNTVLLAIAIARGGSAHALRAAICLIGFSLGVLGGGLMIHRGRAWPANAQRALGLHTLLLIGAAVVWALGPAPSAPVRDVLLGAAGIAMGLQSVSVLAAGTGGVATAYITGTLTQALGRLAGLLAHPHEDRRGRRVRRLAELDWLLYGIGAVAGVLLELHMRTWCFVLPAALTAACLLPARGPAAGRRPARAPY